MADIQYMTYKKACLSVVLALLKTNHLFKMLAMRIVEKQSKLVSIICGEMNPN